MAKTKYDDNFPDLAYGYALDGYTDVQIAKKLGVAPSTYYEYQKQYPLFAEAVERGKKELDGEVENRLLDLVLGHCQVTTVTTDDEGKSRTSVRTVPPNVKAIIHWLQSRDPEHWRLSRPPAPPPVPGSRKAKNDAFEEAARNWDPESWKKYVDEDDLKLGGVATTGNAADTGEKSEEAGKKADVAGGKKERRDWGFRLRRPTFRRWSTPGHGPERDFRGSPPPTPLKHHYVCGGHPDGSGFPPAPHFPNREEKEVHNFGKPCTECGSASAETIADTTSHRVEPGREPATERRSAEPKLQSVKHEPSPKSCMI